MSTLSFVSLKMLSCVFVLIDFPGHFGRRLDWENLAVHICRAICICGSGNDKQEEGR